jgi:hypothetical protein
MKKTNKRLSLSRITLRVLDPSNLRIAGGTVTTNPNSCTCHDPSGPCTAICSGTNCWSGWWVGGLPGGGTCVN